MRTKDHVTMNLIKIPNPIKERYCLSINIFRNVYRTMPSVTGTPHLLLPIPNDISRHNSITKTMEYLIHFYRNPSLVKHKETHDKLAEALETIFNNKEVWCDNMRYVITDIVMTNYINWEGSSYKISLE